MKVVFVDMHKYNCETLGLTLGKSYYVDKIYSSDIDGDEVDYYLTNDYSGNCYYNENFFKTIEDIREEKLNRILLCR